MAVGLAAVVVILAAVALQKDQRPSGTDRTHAGAFIATLRAGQSSCQEGELLPADTAAVRATIGTFGRPGPALQITFRGPRGEQLAAGSLAAGWRAGLVQIPLSHISTSTGGVRVCLRNLGPGEIGIAGQQPYPGFRMLVAGSEVEGQLRYEYMRPGRESWLTLLPTIVYRSTLAKAAPLRPWAWAAALVLMAFAVAFAAWTIVRAERA
jgi:hypothetical protein